ncbi:PREDICTED: uncharacterized protein LOC109174707 [Ipomoea nil]|uniref:uncharacterized protein LOC109174707 n=1 Tax=Ipomoea nil TaxID=35883 RepID=UPI0009017AEB|nr:PREDICTED: uncharacterized protein LOC109174707 [Ipomoea nil]
MTSRRINGLNSTPTYVGEESSVFSIKLHIGGDLVWHPTVGYRDGGVEFFDHFNCDEGSILDLRRMVKQLRYADKKVQFWALVKVKGKGRKKPTKTDLKPLLNDADIVSLVEEVPPNKEVEIFVEHLFDDQWDYEVDISRELGDDCLLYDGINQSSENEDEVEGEDQGEEDPNLMDTGASSKQVNPAVGLEGGEVQEVECQLSEEVFKSLENSEDSDGGDSGVQNVFEERNLKKEGFKFEIGMIFKTSDEFKWAVKYYEATRRKDIHFKKNESSRVRVVCRHNDICNWTIFASRSNPKSPFQVKTYIPEHTCGDQDENRTVKSGFLAKMYKDEIKLNTEWGRIQFQEHVKANLKCQVSKHQAYRAKQKALKQLEGDVSEQFNLLNDYCEELKRSNPGTSVKMKLDSEFTVNGRPRFLRLYICFAACKEGFLRGCRPFFGLDGCHLKGCQKGGQLLSAVGVDGDNSLFPIAFAIVEGELKDSWLWFLKRLDSDLNISSNPHAWTLISDKQKGLIPAVEELFPGMEHRFCVRHMHANFVKDGFSGNVLKQKLWAVCKATTEAEYKRQMEELKEINAKAADWLAARDAKHYCRAYFSTFPKTDLLLNNLCESWNSTILNFRDKPILTLCEKLRIYLMTRMQKNRERLKNHPMKICPKICKLIEEEKDRACRYNTYKSAENMYQVDDENFKVFKVSLLQKQCSCRRWDLTGIPCSHAIAAIRKQRERPEDYVHNCYTVDSYFRAYEPAILPISSSELWPKTNLPAPLPPKYKAQPGRPKKKRKISPFEETKKDSLAQRTRKVGEVKRCRVCGQKGHNKATCKRNNPPQVHEMDEVVVGQGDVHIQGQFEDIPVETQVPTFVLDEMEVMTSQPSQLVQSQVPPLSHFISSQQPSGSATPTVITRAGKKFVTVSSLQQANAVQREGGSI